MHGSQTVACLLGRVRLPGLFIQPGELFERLADYRAVRRQGFLLDVDRSLRERYRLFIFSLLRIEHRLGAKIERDVRMVCAQRNLHH